MRIVAWTREAAGPRGRKWIRKFVEAWLWLMSWAPSHTLRIGALRIAGAKIGKDVSLGRGARVLNPWTLSIGAHTMIGMRVTLDARAGLTIGQNCNISDDVTIWTAEHDIQSPDFAMTIAPVAIGDRAWICYRSIILAGADIEEGSVVATGAVVTKSVPPYSVAAGVPARVLGKRTQNLSYQLGRSRL